MAELIDMPSPAGTEGTFTTYDTALNGDFIATVGNTGTVTPNSDYGSPYVDSLTAVVQQKDGTFATYTKVESVEPDTNWIVIRHKNGGARFINKDTVREVLVTQEET